MKVTQTSPFTGRKFERDLPPRLTAAAANPQSAIRNPQSERTLAQDISPDLSRILRPQAAYRWLLPQLAAITPQYIEMTLRGALAGNHVQAWELFDLMIDTDPEIASCVQEFTERVQAKKLIIEAYHEEDEDPSPAAVEKMKLVSAALRKMKPDPAADENEIEGTIQDILIGWFEGQTVLEIDWFDRDGNLNLVPAGSLGDIIAPRSTFWVHPVCYAWDMEGRLGLRVELNALRQTSKNASTPSYGGGGATPSPWSFPSYQPRPSQIDEFPPNKFIIGINKAKSGSALGGARLRVLAWWWCASNFCGDWLLNLAQLFGIPFRKAKYQSGTPESIKEEIRQMLQNAGSAGYILLPEQADVEFIEAGKGSESSPQAFLFEFADRQKRKVLLGQTMSGSSGTTGKGGGQAFGEVESDVKENRIDAGGKYVCRVLNQLFCYILYLNYGEGGENEAPTCRFLQDDEGTIQDAQRDQVLTSMGLKIGVNFLRKKYNVPAPAKDEETVGAQPVDDPNAPDPNAPDVAENEGDPAEASASGAATDLASATESTFEPLLKRLQAIADVEDPELQRSLLEKFLKDEPQLSKAIANDPSIGRALAPKLQEAFIAGLKKGNTP